MVEIARPGKPALQLVLAGSQPLVPKSRGLWGSAKGKIWMAEDWDSPETNAEIAALFHGGPALSDESEG